MSGPPPGDPPGQPKKWVPVDLLSVIRDDPPVSEPRVVTEVSEQVDRNLGRLFGKYRILRRLGWGGMANVYLAHADGIPDHEVAIKVLKHEAALSQATITRFIKEGQAISAIRHPNVIQLVEPPGRTDDGQVYLVMELLTGKPLSDIVSEMFAAGQVFTWPRLAPLILQICRALQAAHKQKIIHRDMKPSNCFCTELDDYPWHIKVLDFGIAKVQSTGASDDSIETPLTQDGVFVGTPHYAAPEIIERRPESAIDGRADIFSLGVMMYQCLTGELPFEKYRKDVLAALFATARERPEPPRSRAPQHNIPIEVEALVMRAMEIDIDKRFANVPELVAAIRATTRSVHSGSESLSEFTPSASASLLETTPPTTGRKGAEPTSPSSARPEPSTPGARPESSSASTSPSSTADISAAASRSSATSPTSSASRSIVINKSSASTAASSLQAAPSSQPAKAADRSAALQKYKPLIIAGLMVAGLLAILALILIETLSGTHTPPGRADTPRAAR